MSSDAGAAPAEIMTLFGSLYVPYLESLATDNAG